MLGSRTVELANGRHVLRRSTPHVLAWSTLTLGFYFIFWYLRFNRELGRIAWAAKEPDRPPVFRVSMAASLLAITLGWLLVLVPPGISFWNSTRRTSMAIRLLGRDDPGLSPPLAALVLGLLAALTSRGIDKGIGLDTWWGVALNVAAVYLPFGYVLYLQRAINPSLAELPAAPPAHRSMRTGPAVGCLVVAAVALAAWIAWIPGWLRDAGNAWIPDLLDGTLFGMAQILLGVVVGILFVTARPFAAATRRLGALLWFGAVPVLALAAYLVLVWVVTYGTAPDACVGYSEDPDCAHAVALWNRMLAPLDGRHDGLAR